MLNSYGALYVVMCQCIVFFLDLSRIGILGWCPSGVGLEWEIDVWVLGHFWRENRKMFWS